MPSYLGGSFISEDLNSGKTNYTTEEKYFNKWHFTANDRDETLVLWGCLEEEQHLILPNIKNMLTRLKL